MRSPLSVGGVILALVLLLGAAAPWDSLTVDRSSGALRGSQTNFFGVNSNLLNRAVRLSPLDGGNITSGTVPAARIDSTIATDAEVLAHTSATNGAHGMSLFGALIAAQANAAAARTQLGLVIGADIQAFDSDLSALAGLSANGIHVRTGTGTAAARTITGTSGRLTVSNGDGVAGNPTVDIDTNTLASAINGGTPNGSGAWLDWSRLRGVPAGFADGTDDGAGGGGTSVYVSGASVSGPNFNGSTPAAPTGAVPAIPQVNGTNVALYVFPLKSLIQWEPQRAGPSSNANASATWTRIGDGFGAMQFDASTSKEANWQGALPSGGWNPTGGLQVRLCWLSEGATPSSNVVWRVRIMPVCGVLSGSLQTNNYALSALVTNLPASAAYVVTNSIFQFPSATNFALGDVIRINVTRLPGGSDTNAFPADVAALEVLQ